MTIGIAPITRLLSTAAVVQARYIFLLNSLHTYERFLLVHPR